MTCASMRERMLDADLPELEGVGASRLARHVRECGHCRGTARAIVHDTRLLAVAIGASASSDDIAPRAIPVVMPATRSRWRRAGAGLALAAGVAAIVVVMRSSSPRVVVEDARLAASSAAALPGAEVRDIPTPVAPNSAQSEAASPAGRGRDGSDERPSGRRAPRPSPSGAIVPDAVLARAVKVEAFPPATAVAPVRLDAPSREALGGRVTVDPPPGTGARIMTTADPSVTVVWLNR